MRSLGVRPGHRRFEDALQDGRVGLVLAARGFDATMGNKFSSYAWPTIRGTILKGLKWDEPLSLDKEAEDGSTLADNLHRSTGPHRRQAPPAPAAFDDVDNRDLVDSALELLPSHERTALLAAANGPHGITGLTDRSTASRSTIVRRVETAKARIIAAGLAPPGHGEGRAVSAASVHVSPGPPTGEANGIKRDTPNSDKPVSLVPTESRRDRAA
jgi:hypothetical protein